MLRTRLLAVTLAFPTSALADITGAASVIERHKGAAMSFRPWDTRLRQPLLIHTHNAGIERAPLEGFLHATQYMDTLGYDAPAKRCRF